MKRSRPPRPRVKLNRDAAWELLDRQGMSRKNPARRSGLYSEYLSQLMNGIRSRYTPLCTNNDNDYQTNGPGLLPRLIFWGRVRG